MKTKSLPQLLIILIMIASTTIAFSQPKPSKIKEETVTYTSDGLSCKGFIAYDENLKGKLPVVMIIPEWWGLNDYPKMRARQLAELGYLAFAVDMFGDGKIAANPQEAQQYTTPFYKDPTLAKSRLDAAMKKAKENPKADPANMAGIGYCFGGYALLNAAKLGADLKGVVSFHGGLGGVTPDKNLLKAKLLICYGGSDKLVPRSALDAFTHQLDSIGADYSVKIYANATHAFTNPASTENGKKFNLPLKYNPQADKDSWNDMKVFLDKVFAKKD
jgi:dienelactone hydrolase